MASSYNNPEDFIAWFIKGDNLAIVTTNGSDEGTIGYTTSNITKVLKRY